MITKKDDDESVYYENRKKSYNDQTYVSQEDSKYRQQFGQISYLIYNGERILDEFKKNLKEAYQKNPEKFQSQEKISTSLELLAKFGSEIDEKVHTNLFIKDIVLKYLESPFPELRKKAASIVFHFSSEQNPQFQKNLSLSNKIIQGLINKLLVIAVSDQDQGVRYETLTTLNSMGKTFNQYLVTEDNIKRLMFCFYDSDPQIQNQSLFIFQKLAPYNPEIIPKIENLIFKLISFLSLKKKNFGYEDANYILSLRIFVNTSLFFIQSKLQILCEILLKLSIKCYEERYQNPLGGMEQEKIIKTILKCYKDIFFIAKQYAIQFFYEVSEFCMRIIQNEDIKLMHDAFKCLSSLVTNSNLNMLFMLKYDIHQIIVEILQKNVSQKIKLQIFKFLGYLGAIEPYYMKKIKKIRERINLQQMKPSEIENLLFQILRKKLNFMKNIHSIGVNFESQEMKNFKNFKRNIRIIENHQKNIDLEEEIYFEKIDKLKLQLNYKEENQEETYDVLDLNLQTEIKIYNLEELLEYICIHTLRLLFEILEHNKDDEIIILILNTIDTIIQHIKVDVFKFRELIFSKILNFFHKNTMKSHFQSLFMIIKQFFNQSQSQIENMNNYLDQTLKILAEKIENPLYQKQILDILLILLDNPKETLKHKLKDFVNTLLSILQSDPLNDNVINIFQILQKLDNKDYIYHIMPVFTRIISNCIKPLEPQHSYPKEIIEHIYIYFDKTLRSNLMQNYFSNIIRISIKLLDQIQHSEEFSNRYQNIDIIIKKYLIKMLHVLKENCLVHLPLIHEHLKYEQEYQQILITLKETGFFESNKEEYQNQKIPMNQPFNEDDSKSFIKQNLKKIQVQNFIQLFDVSNNYKHEDWEDWFNKLKVDLIINSPCYILTSCNELTCIQEIVKHLFKPAFAVLWFLLNDVQKAEILKNFDTIISNPQKVPMLVLKELLELIEFMSHGNVNGMNLDVRKLGFLAIKCLSLPKAIYFKEQEYQYSSKYTIEGLFYLYTQVQILKGNENLSLEIKGQDIKVQLFSKRLDSINFSKKDMFQFFQEQEDISTDPILEQIKQHNATSKWEFTIQKLKDFQKNSDKIQNQQNMDEIIGIYGSEAAFHLAQWDLLEIFNQKNQEAFEKEFYQTCVFIKRDQFEKAKKGIYQMRSLFQKEGISLGNYNGSYRKFLTLQKISELEDIIKFKKKFQKIQKNELYQFMMGEKAIEEYKDNVRKSMLKKWEDNLNLIQSNIRYWEEILALRHLLCSDDEMIPYQLKLADLCLKQEHHHLYKQIFAQINQKKNIVEKIPKLKLSFCEMEFQTGQKDEQGLINFANEIISEKDINQQDKQRFFKKVAKWFLNQDDSNYEHTHMLDCVINILQESLIYVKDDFKYYHFFAFANFKALKKLKSLKKTLLEQMSHEEYKQKSENYIIKALEGFAKSISIRTNTLRSFVIQDLLRIIYLWFNYGKNPNVLKFFQEKVKSNIAHQDWMLVVGQIIAKLDEENQDIRNSIKNLLIELSMQYPQTLIFSILIAQKTKGSKRNRVAKKILLTIKQNFPNLEKEATIFSNELIRISVLLEEQWYNGIGEAWKYVQNNNFNKMRQVLDNLHQITNKNQNTINEIGFIQQFGTELQKAKELMDMYFQYGNKIFLSQAWNFYADFYHLIERRFSKFENIYLENVSKDLLNFKNSELFVPGCPPDIKIKKIHSVLKVLQSKRKPRKLALYGMNNKKYFFLLKGNEDLRQDERVQQFLNLVNDLFKKNESINFRSLKIVTLNVLPLSVNTGLISWLDNCDTLTQCIRSYRERFGIFPETEKRLAEHFTNKYDQLSKMRKLEIYRYVCDHTLAEDLKKIFWLRNTSAENWLIYRTNYIDSLAVMSMVGYILGLGDRHLSNLMIQNKTGKIVHIDFGDCFETASKREKLPEKVPFRLTRVLVNAMEAFGIEGSFKSNCENVMRLLRSNKDSLIAILEEFVTDPLITWRMLAENEENTIEEGSLVQTNDLKIIESMIESKMGESSKNHSFIVEGALEMEIKQQKAYGQEKKNKNIAKEAISRIKSKLNGKDFDKFQNCKDQVKELLKQATSHENISQAYSGWNPFL